jgi:hypothetical protein
MAHIDRRELFQAGAAMLAAGALARTGFTQAAPAPAAGQKIRIDAYSRTLHWLRAPEEVAEACHRIGNTTIDLTVRAYPGHVDPAKVKTDLPPFVKALERGGIAVTVLGADINDDKTPYVEEMLGTASSLGIRHHWWRASTSTVRSRTSRRSRRSSRGSKAMLFLLVSMFGLLGIRLIPSTFAEG